LTRGLPDHRLTGFHYRGHDGLQVFLATPVELVLQGLIYDHPVTESLLGKIIKKYDKPEIPYYRWCFE
jgi:hypothetical protein